MLHDPTIERDACGIGFVADSRGRASNATLQAVLQGLRCVKHRGAVSADRKTGDGAGVLLPLPKTLLPRPDAGVAMVFLREQEARTALEQACRAEGLEPLDWRPVPVELDALGALAQASAPAIEQLFVAAPADVDADEAERRAYRARRRAERAGPGALYVASFSFRTVTYKALCAADQLERFYADLRDPSWEIPFGIFHQRFSTNTLPSWENAQPFRTLCHNGEINAIQGNVNWMRAREGRLGSGYDELLRPVIQPGGSDSAMLDNALELLVHGGRDIREAITTMIPPAWELDEELEPRIREFYRFQSTVVEPWDGPAGIIYTDGRLVGAKLDRNGLRPLRTAVCEDGFVVCCSEAGAVDLSGHGTVRRGKLHPGEIIAVDPKDGFEDELTIKRRLAARHPYGRWLEKSISPCHSGSPVDPPQESLTARHALFGYTREEIAVVLRPTAAHAHEPTSSMGDDAAIPPLAGRARPLFAYFKQRFAQVTNPPIDHLRERYVMSIRTLLGPRAPILSQGSPTIRLIEIDSFILFPGALDELEVTRLDATFTREEGLEAACRRLARQAIDAVTEGALIIAVTDAGAGRDRAAIPSLLATGAVHHGLVTAGLRTTATLVVESDEPREVHHFACLVGYGAEAVCPRLALETLAAMAEADKIGGDRPSPAEAQTRFRTAIEDGFMKVMSKMGISDIASYCGAQIFEAIGLAQEVVELGFVGTPSRIGGVRFAELEREALARLDESSSDGAKLENPGYFKYRKGGEPHATSVEVVDALHAVTDEMKAAHLLRRAVTLSPTTPPPTGSPTGRELYDRFAAMVNERQPLDPRDLLELVSAGEPVPLDQVEPVEAVVRRFSGGAMSLGALSPEAHELIAVALNRLGARSNSGEGGEDPARFRGERNSKIKQIASGRFGVTPEYAAYAEELQIKIAQGSKPGEGGQLPGHKVTEEIARLRHTRPGIALISPPPHHDIYSIEDLAQLIFDLKQVNRDAAVSVKLVAEDGVGIIAAGCVKALADVVHIAGCDGGTGASPLSSIKNAGAPWELGLAETQQALVANGLRGRVRLRVDGGFKTGRDVVVAALLGADEMSFGTALLLAEGCLMVRSCHMDTCPVGIATQRPELREKFAGSVEAVQAYLLFVAQEVREHLARLGLRSLEEAIGRVELLRQRGPGRSGDPRGSLLDLSPLLAQAGEGPRRYVGQLHLDASGHELGDRLADEATPALDGAQAVELAYEIGNCDRTVGARLGGRIGARYGLGKPPGRVRATFTGVAGQSFGAFLAAGVELLLVGEANDYVGKSMSGGRVVIRPPQNDAGDPVLIGNTVLYGATGGELYCAGAAGERFGVRLSGTTAVVEGTGDHACEYMTSGTVAILGESGMNLGAGMSGGEVFVYDPLETVPLRLNTQLVRADRLSTEEEERLRTLVERHLQHTGSARAAELLAAWDDTVASCWRIAPKAEVAKLANEAEGTIAGKAG